MATWLYKLGRICYLNKWKVLAIWILIMVGLGALSSQKHPMSNSFSIPGLPSVEAMSKLGSIMGGDSGKDPFTLANVQIAIKSPQGTKLTDPDNVAAVNQMLTTFKKTPKVNNPEKILNPALTQDQMVKQLVMMGKKLGKSDSQALEDAQLQLPISPNKTVEYIDLDFSVESPADVTQESVDNMKAAAQQLRDKGFQTELSGSVISYKEMPAGGGSEMIGILVAALILILTFGSLVAWGLPIIAAILGVSIGMLLITCSTIIFDINTNATSLATMIGLAVAIDYSLFVLFRYRHELRKRNDPEEAVSVAVGTAGSAVVFAGLTVLISLLALSVVRISFLTQMAFGAAATVAIAILIAITLLPALIGIFGKKTFAGKVPFVHPPDTDRSLEALHRQSMGSKVINVVTKFAPIVFTVVAVALLALSFPAKDIHLALPGASTMDKSSSERKSYDMLAAAFGPGHNSPLMVVMENNTGDKAKFTSSINQMVKLASSDNRVEHAYLSAVNPKYDTALITVISKSDTNSVDTQNIVHKLREQKANYKQDYATNLEVTGEAAVYIDVSEKLSASLIPYVAIISVLCILILLLIFRSIWVPLSAALGFILTIAATFGATVAIFQKGMFGIQSEVQPIISFLPIMAIGIIFGLAMDYQVFLVTRMREEYVHGAPAKEAVKHGYTYSVRIVATAATIMISVFMPFVLSDMSLMREMGFTMAAGVLFDAFFVRMVLIPAFLYMMGDKAWYLPKWMDKILPRLDIEGEGLVKHLDQKHAKTHAKAKAAPTA